MTFYQAFEIECSKPTLVVGNYLTDSQKESVFINGTFFDKLKPDDFHSVAHNLVSVLQTYNRRTDRQERHVIPKKQSNILRAKDIRKTEAFLDVLNDHNKFVRREHVRETMKELIKLTKEFTQALQDEEIVFYSKHMVSSKTPLKEMIAETEKKYNLKFPPSKVKQFIDHLDEPFTDYSDSADPMENY